MKRFNVTILLIHAIAFFCEFFFLLILLFGKGEWKWEVGAMSLNIGMASIGLIGLWNQINGLLIKESSARLGRGETEEEMNKVILMGRLTRDPEVRYSQGERAMAVARYTLAVDRIGRRNQDGNEQTADFINCVAFDKAGEFSEKHFRQGMRVLISGRIQTGSYTNKEGVKIYTTDIIIETQEFADSKNASGGDGGQTASRPEPSSAVGDGFMNIPDGVEDSGSPFN